MDGGITKRLDQIRIVGMTNGDIQHNYFGLGSVSISLGCLLRAVPGDVRTRGTGLGQVGFRSGFGVQRDLASTSGSLHRLVFCVWDLVVSGGQVARSNGKTSGEARGQ